MINEEMQCIISQVDGNWNKDYIIRYLYVNLAPFFKRDLKYFLASEEEKFREYQAGFVNRGFDIVCSTLADFYVNLFNTLGIRAKKIIANSAKIPLFAIIVEGDNGWYFLDPINDLFPNQYGLETTEFGNVPHYQTLRGNYPYLLTLPKDYVDSMDNALGIDKSLSLFFKELHLDMTNKKYVSDYFDVSSSDLNGLFCKKMNFANQHLINLGQVNGTFERIKLYLFLERIMFFKNEKKNITIYLDRNFAVPKVTLEYHNPINNLTSCFVEDRSEDGFSLIMTK